MTPSSSTPRQPRRRLSQPPPWPLVAATLFLLGAILFALTRPLLAGQRGEAAPPPVAATDPLHDPAIRASELEQVESLNLLLLGTDGRDEQDGPPRTDLMMLVMIDRTAQRLTLVSIPRDLWVPIPGYGEGKINTAFFLGALEGDGAALARQTVAEVLGVTIHHTVQVDFEGFRALVDEMGGLTVEVAEAIDDPDFPDGNYGTLHLAIPAGPQHFDGEMALRYARTRHGGTDQQRSARQQAILAALREQALQPEHLARAPLYLRTLYRVVESDLTLGDFFALARFGRGLEREAVQMHTINGDLTWPTLTWNGQDALLYDPDALRATLRGWQQGEAGARAD